MLTLTHAIPTLTHAMPRYTRYTSLMLALLHCRILYTLHRCSVVYRVLLCQKGLFLMLMLLFQKPIPWI